ncbi:MAG: tRNA (adenosine(37)-N6)-dimethylallyltransferase MiaA [Longicatena sp.]
MEKIVIIVGPTGVGKTSLSISLAKTFNGEIISGDSMQVYKEMSIGTAKVRNHEKEDIPHYLIDEFHFNEDYNVKVFQQKAREYIKLIQEHHHLPIICGGTGLYCKAAIYDYTFLEQAEDTSFMQFLQTCSHDELWSLLTIIDPKVCEVIHPNNKQRIIRALSMAHNGEKKSDIIEAQEHIPIFDVYVVGLTMEREHLYERINQRVDQMMADGLLDEIKQLVNKHEDVWSLQSFQGIGYKEWKPYFEGNATIEECVELIKKNSRNFAKRQYTWFRNQMQVHWYDIEDDHYKEEIQNDIKKYLGEE